MDRDQPLLHARFRPQIAIQHDICLRGKGPAVQAEQAGANDTTGESSLTSRRLIGVNCRNEMQRANKKIGIPYGIPALVIHNKNASKTIRCIPIFGGEGGIRTHVTA